MTRILLQKPKRGRAVFKRIVFGAAGAFYAWVGVMWGILAAGPGHGGGPMLPLALIAAPVVLGLIFWPIIGILLVDISGDLSHFFFKLLMSLHYVGVLGVMLLMAFWHDGEEWTTLMKAGLGPALLSCGPYFAGQAAIWYLYWRGRRHFPASP
jgi:hypothetical protein